MSLISPDAGTRSTEHMATAISTQTQRQINLTVKQRRSAIRFIFFDLANRIVLILFASNLFSTFQFKVYYDLLIVVLNKKIIFFITRQESRTQGANLRLGRYYYVRYSNAKTPCCASLLISYHHISIKRIQVGLIYTVVSTLTTLKYVCIKYGDQFFISI